jgi:hypothetical protein
MSPQQEHLIPPSVSALDNGWLTYTVPANLPNGGVLLLNGARLRATQIAVFATDVEWSPSGGNPVIKTPHGDGVVASGAFTFPGLNRLCAVLFSGPVKKMITGTSEANAEKILLAPDKDICVTVNDGKAGYSDNVGSFRVHVRVLK